MTKDPNPKQTPMTNSQLDLGEWDLRFDWDLGPWSLVICLPTAAIAAEGSQCLR
jgi:hypothetical protein